YAEFFGDDSNLVLDAPNQAAFNNAAASGKPMVTLLFSGRPMIVNDVMDASQAFIAAWLPGSEGDGMTDVLFGDYAPTGKLSFTWPRTAAQNPINVGDENYDPLFPFGFGLTF
ncbi:MAG: glycoside hydrolase family 3 C-terminal domain-containing protein, partial [Bacteroidetes Order II. Incertae sedis bacterium]|nr:glycoside hydrolase family 3 C-terminal domain-containing protein [Bacteroidetes Order II. bacterium]